MASIYERGALNISWSFDSNAPGIAVHFTLTITNLNLSLPYTVTVVEIPNYLFYADRSRLCAFDVYTVELIVMSPVGNSDPEEIFVRLPPLPDITIAEQRLKLNLMYIMEGLRLYATFEV